MKKFFFVLTFFLFTSSISLAEYRLEPTNCTAKKKDNCGAYLYDTKTGSTYFCTSEKCTEILEALEGNVEQEAIGKKIQKNQKFLNLEKRRKKNQRFQNLKSQIN